MVDRVLVASIIDRDFQKDPRARFVTGCYTDPWLQDYQGVGPSLTPYSMKALLVDGVVYRPLSRGEMARLYPTSGENTARRWVPNTYQPPAANVRTAKEASND